MQVVKRHLFAYINHAALNAGAAIACVWYCVVPPQWTGHAPEQIDDLATGMPWSAFWTGVVALKDRVKVAELGGGENAVGVEQLDVETPERSQGTPYRLRRGLATGEGIPGMYELVNRLEPAGIAGITCQAVASLGGSGRLLTPAPAV